MELYKKDFEDMSDEEKEQWHEMLRLDYKNEVRDNIDAKLILNELMAATIGGDIQGDASQFISHEHVIIHCWDGRRYLLSITKLPDGCQYDPKTGSPI